MASDKVSPRARSLIAEAAGPEPVPVIIKFKTGRGRDVLRAQFGEVSVLNIRQDFSMVPATAVDVPPDRIDEIAEMEDVEQVWFDEYV
ncbi:MAG: hypothetical protein D6790_19340, partial [Caldilineae bacterium]